jgi:hypothetical protein
LFLGGAREAAGLELRVKVHRAAVRARLQDAPLRETPEGFENGHQRLGRFQAARIHVQGGRVRAGWAWRWTTIEGGAWAARGRLRGHRPALEEHFPVAVRQWFRGMRETLAREDAEKWHGLERGEQAQGVARFEAGDRFHDP